MGKGALVTGGAGFIGSHVCEDFLARGWTVEVIDDLSSGKRANVPPGVRLHVCDVRSDTATSLVREGRFDVIVHLAAQMDVRRSVAEPAFDAATNILGTISLLEALRGSPSAARFVFSSTGGAVYGDFAPIPTRETEAKDPESPYGIAKLSGEHYLAYYGRVHGVDAVSLRFGNVYGPRQDPHGEAGVIAIFCSRLIDGLPLRINGDGEQTRDYVYVSDVAAAVFAAATHDLPARERLDARAFNVGTGVATSVNTLSSILLEAAETPVPVEHAPARAGEQRHSVLDIGKARKLLGWRPAMELKDGLKNTFEWFSQQRSTVRT